ncbi:MAG: hydrogenase maturation nickel metallochaperone HypA [Pseudomonadota bacterium]
MHEMGIARQLFQIALDYIPDDIENPVVEQVNLKVGRLAAVVEHSLTFCFEVISKDTPLENAILKIDFIPVTIHCRACDNKWEVDNPVFTCPYCDKNDIELVTGREIQISSIILAD